MTFRQAMDYLTDALKFGINPSLEKITEVCRILRDPQAAYGVIQITGTNGKTSVARMAAAVLRERGHSVGLYTSPHLSSYTERIVIDGCDISDADFGEAIGYVRPALDSVSERLGELTEFEILTAAALAHFATAGVDVAVLEVGLGGRWDATSVTRPAVSVVTNVDLEHQDRLGGTIRDIAWDKAHVIKEGSKAIVGLLSPEALHEMRSRCRLVGAPLSLFGRDFDLIKEAREPGGSEIAVRGLFAVYRDLHLRVLGAFQPANAAVAVAAVEAFIGGPLTGSAVANGLFDVSCPGRMEIISDEPVVLIDGAHNPAGIRKLVSSLRAVFGDRRLVIVLSVSSDKDVEGIIAELTPEADRLILTRNKSYRSATEEELAARAGSTEHETEPDLGRAIARAIELSEGGVVVVTGSLYAIGEARDILAADGCARGSDGLMRLPRR